MTNLLKTITITAWKRPKYLEQALESIRVANPPEGYVLVCGVDPGDRDCLRACNRITWIDKIVHDHPKKKGIRDNPFFVMNDVFNRMGSVFNVYMEEDVILSPDAFRIAEWYYEQTRVDQERWMSLNFFHPGLAPTKDKLGLMESKNFNALGFAITKPAWDRWFRPHWYDDNRSSKVYGEKDHQGWDWSMTATLALEKSLMTLTPCVLRANHIGRNNGVHASPKFHDENFAHLKICDDPHPGTYTIRSFDGTIYPYVESL